MKVLILHNDLRVYWKGRIKYLRQFLGARDISLYAIELFGKGSPYSFDPYDSDNCLFPNNSYTELSKAEIKNKLFKKLDEINPDIIIGGSIVFFSGALGLRWCKAHKKTFVMFDDGKPSDIKRNFIVQYIKDAITSQVDALWLPSKEYDAEYTGVFNVPVPIFYGYNTIDNSLFKFDKKKELNHKTIICVARLVDIKNIDNLLKAWKIVEEKNKEYKLQIIGSGPAQDRLITLKGQLGLNRVSFVGLVANSDIPAYLFNSDALILPSFAESWGLVVNEAMAAGLPVLLSTKVNAATSLLQDGENGYIFDAHKVDEIGGKILKFINLDAVSKQAMSDKSLQIIGEMDYENMGSSLVKFLNNVAGNHPKKATLPGSLFMNLWRGGYNTSGWDK